MLEDLSARGLKPNRSRLFLIDGSKAQAENAARFNLERAAFLEGETDVIPGTIYDSIKRNGGSDSGGQAVHRGRVPGITRLRGSCRAALHDE